MSPDEVRAEIRRLRVYRRGLVWLLLVYFGLCLPPVVITALTAERYTTLALMLWCSVPLVVMTLIALLVIYVRDRISDTIHALQAELEATEPAPKSPDAQGRNTP